MYNEYLEYKQKGIYVFDYQLIYLTDNKIQYEFYADGKRFENCTLMERASYFVKKNYGMIMCKAEDENAFKINLFRNIENTKWIHMKIEQMLSDYDRLQKSIEMYEGNIGSVGMTEIISLYNDFISVMSYRGFCGAILERNSCKWQKHNINDLIPSYILLYNKMLNELLLHLNEERFEEFKWEYGYLINFDMDLGVLENYDDFLRAVHEEKVHAIPNVDYDISRQKYISSFEKNDDKSIYYSISWAEEMRHILQQRVLRDIRVGLELNGFDPYKAELGSKNANLSFI